MTTELTPMQTELLKRSDAIMDSLGKTISSAVDFSKEQIPDIAYQYIAFERAYSSFLLILGLFLFFCVFLLVKKMSQKWDDYNIDQLAQLALIASVMGVTGFVLIAVKTKLFFLVWFAPKVFLLQSLASLIKG